MDDALRDGAASGDAIELDEEAGAGAVAGADVAPASFAQQRMWILNELLPSGPAYNVAPVLRLKGALDVDALRHALNAVVDRHETLRTRFAPIDGRAMQVIHAGDAHPLPVEDLQARGDDAEGEARRLATENAEAPFDLAAGPLLRARLFRLAPHEHWLSLCLHHIVTDGWSMHVLWQDIAALYSAAHRGTPAPLADLPLQYADYAIWQRDELQGELLAQQLAYWRGALADLPTLALPTDHPRPAVASYRGDRVSFALPPPLTTELRALGRRHGATLFMTLLAAFQVLLSRYSGQHDLAVGVPIAGRNRPELEGLIGLFVNTLVLRADLSGAPSFRTCLARVKARALDAYAHQDLPFERLVEDLAPRRELARNPLFQAAFTLQSESGRQPPLDALEVTALATLRSTAKFDLTLTVTETSADLDASIEYATDLFERATIERMARHWHTLLAAIVADPEQPVARLPLLTAAEREQLLAFGRGPRTPALDSATLADLFEAQAARTPDALAVVGASATLSYRALDRRANALAQRLHDAGIGPECAVAVCLERSPDLVVALLAIVKAGGAYVPLDPAYPPARLAFMLADTAAAVLVTQASLAARFADGPARVLCLDTDPAHADACAAPPPRAVTPDHLAYVIYTSGSTGQPKGVAVRQKGILRLVRAPNYVTLSATDVVAQLSSVSFDAATFEIWGALLNGGRLVLLDKDVALAPARLAQAIALHAITHLFVTTALLHRIATAQPDALRGARTVLFGGEVCDPRLIDAVVRASAPARFVHVYGPTETTTFATYHVVHDVDPARPVPIGRPLCDTEVLILDAQDAPVPVGIAGELCIGGDGVAAGYLGRADATAERFVRHPLGGDATARIYRTGDLARFRGDGTIEFIGRNDEQVKLRGFRIEPAEIVAALRSHPGVAACHVLARRQVSGDAGLTAYVVPDLAQEPVTAAILRRHLAARLPDYMIPASFAIVDALPLTANGKIDVHALPEPASSAGDASSSSVPRDRIERLLCRIWGEVLHRPPAGIDDDFFDSGGHSMLAATLLARVDEELGTSTPLSAMFEAPTIRALADRYRTRADAAGTGAVTMNRGGTLPPIFGVPGVYGNVIGYAALARALGPQQPFYAMQAVGLDGSEPPLTTIEAMASRCLATLRAVQPRSPYVLVGACFGASVAYEMARQALAAGDEVALLGLLDPTARGGTADAAAPRPAPRAVLRARALGAFLAGRVRLYLGDMTGLDSRARLYYIAGKIRRLAAGIARGTPLRNARREMNEVAVYRANLEALDRYRRTPLPRRPQQVVIFETATDAGASGAAIDWDALCGVGSLRVEVPGKDSGDMLSARHAAALAERLRAALAATFAQRQDESVRNAR